MIRSGVEKKNNKEFELLVGTYSRTHPTRLERGNDQSYPAPRKRPRPSRRGIHKASVEHSGTREAIGAEPVGGVHNRKKGQTV
jgi:hypothetical protein